MSLVLLLAGAYLVGAVPFGFLIGRAAGVDVRRSGSGNIGATNLMRVQGWMAGGATLLLDAGKGALVVAVVRLWYPGDPRVPVAAAVASVVGHCFPVYLAFRGGKGVATAAGALGTLAPGLLLVGLAVFAAAVAATRMVSVGSLAAATVFPLAAWIAGNRWLALGAFLIAAIVFWRHRENLVRIRRGEEGKVRRGGERR